MTQPYGIPGVGGSLGKCCYCGGNFALEIITGVDVRGITVGEQEMVIHDNDKCFGALQALCADGQLQLAQHGDLPEGSPLGAAMKRFFEEQEGEFIAPAERYAESNARFGGK